MVVIIQNVGKIVEGPDVGKMTRGFILDTLILMYLLETPGMI